MVDRNKMCVNVNGVVSDEVEVTSGVPEGSCLSPELFKVILLKVPIKNSDSNL